MANPSDYQTYLDYINNRNSDTWREFWFYNYITDFRQNNRLFSVTKKPYSDYSWIAQSGYYNFTNIGGLRTPPMFASDILDVYISSNGNDLYSYSVSGTSLNNVLTDNSGSFWDIIGLNDNGTVNGNGNNAGQSYSYSLSNTSLESVLSHISRYFKNVNIYVDGEYWSGPTPPIQTITSNGGGATHIAKVTGQLSALSSNLSDILMVSGGGGGGLLAGDTDYSGKEAGGISGSGDNSADQTTGNAFGRGESGTNVSGGGSGLYGGYKGTSSKSGGAGSGYIGNSLVSNKKMVGYNVPTSSSESTKTESVNEASESPVSGKPKIGNGYAKIKFLRSCWGGEEVAILWAGDSNKMTVQISNSDILFKLYTGDIAIYSFTAYAGSTVLDADNIFVHFLIESEQQLAKPSMVYANGSVLSYNQEEPTDAEMADIYTWLSAGLPSA